MLRPENTHPNDQDAVLRDSDFLETATSSGFEVPADSPSSRADAGLIDPDDDAAFGESEDGLEPMEIPMTDTLNESDMPGLHSPVMSDLDTPGRIDIEEMDESALADTDIPRDALLDPLEP